MTLLQEYGRGVYWLRLLGSIFLASSLLLSVMMLAAPNLRLRLLEMLRSMLGMKNSHVRWANIRDSSTHSSEWISRWKNKWHGMTVPAALSILFMICLAVAGTSGYYKLEEKSYPEVKLKDVYVAGRHGRFGYKLIADGIEYNGEFCNTLGYNPPFSESMTIKILQFRNTGTCWDMRNEHPKYVMDVDDQGLPYCPLCEENPTVKEK